MSSSVQTISNTAHGVSQFSFFNRSAAKKDFWSSQMRQCRWQTFRLQQRSYLAAGNGLGRACERPRRFGTVQSVLLQQHRLESCNGSPVVCGRGRAMTVVAGRATTRSPGSHIPYFVAAIYTGAWAALAPHESWFPSRYPPPPHTHTTRWRSVRRAYAVQRAIRPVCLSCTSRLGCAVRTWLSIRSMNPPCIFQSDCTIPIATATHCCIDRPQPRFLSENWLGYSEAVHAANVLLAFTSRSSPAPHASRGRLATINGNAPRPPVFPCSPTIRKDFTLSTSSSVSYRLLFETLGSHCPR